jgi:uncharacterized repeat protein (TIGR03987 family)
MSGLLIFSTTAITLALIFYSIGVWAERKAKTLKKWHVIVLWLGLISDASGTFCMSRIAASGMSDVSAGTAAVHGITGAAAIFLIAFHVFWATYVYSRQDGNKNLRFHRSSLIVWVIWLIPYFIGMIMGMIY